MPLGLQGAPWGPSLEGGADGNSTECPRELNHYDILRGEQGSPRGELKSRR